MAAVLLTGKLWIRVPEIIRVEITGTPNAKITGKDLILHVIKTLRADGAVYKAIEFVGSAVRRLSVEQRAVLTNMSVEMGAKASFIPVDETTRTEITKRRDQMYTTPTTDPDYTYSDQFLFDITELRPQVAVPGAVDEVVDVEEVAGTVIDQVYIGGCTGGSLEDIVDTAMQLRGNSIARGVKVIVSPASRTVFQQAIEAGYISEIVRAGGTVINPGCGPCLGVHQGVLAPGEVCISSASRNFPGRMGSTEAEIYLASSATAAASAIQGKIALPR